MIVTAQSTKVVTKYTEFFILGILVHTGYRLKPFSSYFKAIINLANQLTQLKSLSRSAVRFDSIAITSPPTKVSGKGFLENELKIPVSGTFDELYSGTNTPIYSFNIYCAFEVLLFGG